MSDPDVPSACMGKAPEKAHCSKIQEILERFHVVDPEKHGTVELSVLKSVLNLTGLGDADVFRMIQKSQCCYVSYEKLIKWIYTTDQEPIVAPTAQSTLRDPALFDTTLDSTISFSDVVEPSRSKIQRSHTLGMSAKAKGFFNAIAHNAVHFKQVQTSENAKNVAVEDGSPCKVNWKCGTWNAAGELTKFEFLPLPNAFADKLERLMGAAILSRRGQSKDLALYKTKSWKRYKVDDQGWPRKEDLDFLDSLTIADILDGFDADQLCAKWGMWAANNPSGKEGIQNHINNWCQKSLSTFFQVAMGKVSLDLDVDGNSVDVIPGFASGSSAIISNPDSWFSTRTYHIRGEQWTDFVSDATKTDFTGKHFWQKWIKGISETYRWDAAKPIEFCPSETDFDFVATALWDRFAFLVASRVALAGEGPKDTAQMQMIQAQLDIPKDKALQIVKTKLDWVIDTAKIDVLCLQEAGSLAPPEGWRCFPKIGASTVVWVTGAKVDEDRTRKAEELLTKMKAAFSEAGKVYGVLEESMKSQVRKVVDGIITDGLPKLRGTCSMHKQLEDALYSLTEGLMAVFENNAHLSDKDRAFKKVQRWFTEDKLAVVVARLGNGPCLVLSAHGESGGHTSRQVLFLAKCLQEEMKVDIPDLGIMIGMDANVKRGNTGAACSPEVLVQTATQLGLSSCNTSGTDGPMYAGLKGQKAEFTVVKTRSFVQPQLAGKAGVADANMKDYVFYAPPEARKETAKLKGRVINHMTENDPEGLYVDGGMPRGLDFPSDHALVIVESES